ncbi:probable 28S ribosomal protein S25, mitochondrial [Hylaeus volcanicus]|uniref:probable 28S ribosomal protein S25, mitochondrial n=1 Tax=Hylaeus volcanicus TaxID=313075 RepID=UPI0023B79EBD|nr:probable 28S ribosomal protein S25, mitochondrial [Hylaeus volcanicus]XP_053990496.1 probable 28S ribosomal protein S25, mitochondrial [Hylaeus volcanicus]XP_053990497.1 probable 28S ribosomal protein S25, mitochondrial [Hylaeus volcanicus]
MPFMIGLAPIRRTLPYLETGKLVLKEMIQIFSINYNTHGLNHQGVRDFVFWNLPQIQYKNPSVQVITFKNMTPTPFIRCYYDDGKTMLIDVDNRNKEDIMEHLIKVVGKSEEILRQESISKEKRESSANFGIGCPRSCICVVPNQVPCPGTVPLPYHMRNKTRKLQKEDL